jgi:hypothetical protein
MKSGGAGGHRCGLGLFHSIVYYSSEHINPYDHAGSALILLQRIP